jgi:DNA repair protein RadC
MISRVAPETSFMRSVLSPKYDPSPSHADIAMTKAIIDIGAPLGISVHDHIIVGKNGHASLKELRLI